MRNKWIVIYGSEVWVFETETQADNKIKEVQNDLQTSSKAV